MTAARISGPAPTRYFDDFAVGERFVTGEETLSEAEIVAFARRFDPSRSTSIPRAQPTAPMAA